MSDLRAFEDAMLPHLDAAHNLARWLLRNEQDAEDCVQEAFLRAWRAFPRYRTGDSRAWFLTIVRRLCYSHLRDLGRRQEAAEFDEEIHGITAAETTSIDRFEREATREMLEKAMEELNEEYREVIVLHELEGLAYKEIAEVAGIPIGTVMSRLARARQRLQQAILAQSNER
jgi:RNA polymerase sigma-70 factor (ECF subfamily)